MGHRYPTGKLITTLIYTRRELRDVEDSEWLASVSETDISKIKRVRKERRSNDLTSSSGSTRTRTMRPAVLTFSVSFSKELPLSFSL